MSESQQHQAFIQAVLAGDDTARLVFADYLEERGEYDTAAALRQDGYAGVPQWSEGLGFSLWWFTEVGEAGADSACRLGPIACPCGERARFYRCDRRQEYLCRECNAKARDARWRRRPEAVATTEGK